MMQAFIDTIFIFSDLSTLSFYLISYLRCATRYQYVKENMKALLVPIKFWFLVGLF